MERKDNSKVHDIFSEPRPYTTGAAYLSLVSLEESGSDIVGGLYRLLRHGDLSRRLHRATGFLEAEELRDVLHFCAVRRVGHRVTLTAELTGR